MNKKTKNDRYVIKPNFKLIFVVLIALLVVYYILNHGIKMHRPQDNVSVLHAALLVGLLFSVSRGYILDTQSFTVSFFLIPMRKIYWNQVGEVVFIRKSKNTVTSHTDGIILITLLNCEPFCIGKDRVFSYASRHPFSVFSIHIPEKRVDEYIAVFKNFYEDVVYLDCHD